MAITKIFWIYSQLSNSCKARLSDYILSPVIDVALKAVREGAQISIKYFEKIPKVIYKPDNSPVTIADKTAEKIIRNVISSHFPDHGIIGEELPPINPGSEYQWIIDPIDGTKDFIRKIPTWASFIGVLKAGKPYLGVIYYPCFDEMFHAEAGKGAYLNNSKTQVSKVKNLKDAYLAHSSIKRTNIHGKLANLVKITEMVYHERNFGSYSIAQLLKGNIDFEIAIGGSMWDFVAPSILVQEAGGTFSDISGKFSYTSNNMVLSNGLLHDKVIKLLNS